MFARLLVLFVAIPLIELALFLTVGDWIGLPITLATVILTGILGAALTKSQGLKVLQRYRHSMSEGRLPHQEVLEGILILVAGAVLLTPGFLTDAVGFLLLTPPVRAAVVARLKHSLKSRVRLVVPAAAAPTTPPPTRVDDGQGKVIDVEVVED